MIRQRRVSEKLRPKRKNDASESKSPPKAALSIHRDKIRPAEPNDQDRSIPHTLALTWETHDLCTKMQGAVDSWAKLDHALDVRVFNRREREALVSFDPKVKNAYHLVSRNSAKADIWRLAYLYLNGGYYSDIDQICKMPVSKFIPGDAEFVICTRHPRKKPRVPTTANGLMGARPKCKIIRYLLYSICEHVIKLARDGKTKILRECKGHEITGPLIIGRLLNVAAGRKEGTLWNGGMQKIGNTKAFFVEHIPRVGFYVDGQFVVKEKYDEYEEAIDRIQR